MGLPMQVDHSAVDDGPSEDYREYASPGGRATWNQMEINRRSKQVVYADNGGMSDGQWRTFAEHCPAVKHACKQKPHKHAKWWGYPREHPPRDKLRTIRLATEESTALQFNGPGSLPAAIRQT